MIHNIKARRDCIFPIGAVLKRLTKPYHTLFLQLLATGIIRLDVVDNHQNLIGTKNLSIHCIVTRMGKNSIDGNEGPVMIDSLKWD
jgi:hypothetical protein